MHTGLRARFIFLLSIISIVIFTVLAIAIARQNIATLRTNLNQKAKIFSQLATKPIGDTFVLYKDSGRTQITKQAQRFFDLDSDVRAVSVINTNGTVLYSYGTDTRSAVTVPDDGNFNPTYITNQAGMITQVIQPFIEDFGGHRYSLVYSFSTDKVSQQTQQVTRIIIITGLLFLLVTIFASYFLFNRIFIRPVRQLSKLAAVISAGNLDQQITMSRKDEIGDLARAVNTMAEKLKADIVKLQATDKLKSEFMMIASHNLRTPLTIMQGYLEMSQEAEQDEKVKQYLQTIQANIIRLTEFAEDVITISTIEAGDAKLNATPLTLQPFLERLAQEFSVIAESKGIAFTPTIQTDAAIVNVSTAHFKSALWNLLDNAYKFTKPDGQIELRAVHSATAVTISVTDTGAGIPSEEMPKLFTKFHRGTDTIRYDYEGVGIGLYLTKLLIEKFNGTIAVTSEVGKGSTFTITLPVTSQPIAEDSATS